MRSPRSSRALAIDAVRQWAFDGQASASWLRRAASTVEGRAAVVLFFYDSVVRVRAEQALAESQTRFRRLLDAVPDAVALGHEGFAVSSTRTRAGVRLLGYEQHGRGHFSSRSGSASIPKDRPAARGIRRAQGAHPRTGGQQRPAQASTSPEGQVRGARRPPAHRDRVGRRARASRDLSRPGPSEDGFKAQLIRADFRLAAIGTLAAGVAHEINNPLAYLMLNLQYLMRELPRFDGDSVRLKVLLSSVSLKRNTAARRVSTIVGDLRTLSRARTRSGSRRSSVQDTPPMRAGQARQRGNPTPRCRVVPEDYDPKSPLVNANVDAARAGDHESPHQRRPRDSRGTSRKHNEMRISVQARTEIRVLVVSVQRHGRRYLARHRSGRIFRPVFHDEAAWAWVRDSDLPISRGIVKSFGGEIGGDEASSARGTTFSVSLPALTR